MAVRLALDAVLKRVARLGELSNNLVATLSSAIFTQTRAKIAGSAQRQIYGKPFSAPASGVPPCPAAFPRHDPLRHGMRPGLASHARCSRLADKTSRHLDAETADPSDHALIPLACS